jgi:hypothetical protein
MPISQSEHQSKGEKEFPILLLDYVLQSIGKHGYSRRRPQLSENSTQVSCSNEAIRPFQTISGICGLLNLS